MVLALEDVRHQLEQSIVDTIQFPEGWGGHYWGGFKNEEQSKAELCRAETRQSEETNEYEQTIEEFSRT